MHCIFCLHYHLFRPNQSGNWTHRASCYMLMSCAAAPLIELMRLLNQRLVSIDLTLHISEFNLICWTGTQQTEVWFQLTPTRHEWSQEKYLYSPSNQNCYCAPENYLFYMVHLSHPKANVWHDLLCIIVLLTNKYCSPSTLWIGQKWTCAQNVCQCL